MKHLNMLILLLILPVHTLARRNVAFIGLSGNNAPSLEKGYENLLREKLSMESDLLTKDYLECQKLRRTIKFDDYPAVSRNYLETLVRFSDDSLLIIWGAVKSFQLNNKRKKLIFTGIEGELMISLHIYSLYKRDFLFIGDVSAVVHKPKGIGLFQSGNLISAKDRTELIEMLQNEAVSNSCRIISAAIRAENAKMEDTGKSKLEEVREPSISDVFSIPSAEPAQIEPAGTIDTIDTLKKEKE